MTPGIPQWRILEELHAKFKVKETEVNSLKLGGNDVQIQQGGLICYIEFSNRQAALNMPREIVVDGVPVKLWHKGYYECSTCKMKGHTEEFHDRVMKAKENNANRRTLRNSRK